MLKHRIIPTVLYRGDQAYKGKQFQSWRPVGAVMQAVRVYDRREVDELICLDISETAHEVGPDIALIERMAEECFMPLTIGGGISSLHQIRECLLVGADKVSIRTAAQNDSRLIEDAAMRFGSQAIVVSLDINDDNEDRAIGLAETAQRRGAGEILLTDMRRDGMMDGYNLRLISSVCAAVDIPVIASGGAGTYEHMAQALGAGAHAVAAGAMFHFTDATPRGAALYLDNAEFPVRVK